MLVLYEPSNCIVRPAKVAFCFEFQIRHQTCLRTSNIAVVAEFVLHLAEQDPSHVYVRLCDEARRLSARRLVTHKNVTHNRSPVFKNLITAMPSIILAAELPRNLLLGFSVPSTRILCSGAMKK
jgi:hypothetical protein